MVRPRPVPAPFGRFQPLVRPDHPHPGRHLDHRERHLSDERDVVPVLLPLAVPCRAEGLEELVLIGRRAAEDDGEEFFDEQDAATVETIKELLETRIRPAVAGDGGDITFRGFKDGTVYLVMKGACSGCPSSTATLRHGIQNLLRHFLPDVREVQAV